jgi:hypothetical protein
LPFLGWEPMAAGHCCLLLAAAISLTARDDTVFRPSPVARRYFRFPIPDASGMATGLPSFV